MENDRTCVTALMWKSDRTEKNKTKKDKWRNTYQNKEVDIHSRMENDCNYVTALT